MYRDIDMLDNMQEPIIFGMLNGVCFNKSWEPI